VWCAIKLGMPAGLSALIVGMQPILTAFAAPLIGERVTPRQWLGLLFGIAGVALVVYAKIAGRPDVAGYRAVPGRVAVDHGRHAVPEALVSALRPAHRHGDPVFRLFPGATLPFAVAFEALTPTLEAVTWTPRFVGALLWSVLGLSIGAIFLLFALIRRSDATQVTSLLYLTPPTTALMAWLVFGEAFSLLGVAGMALAVTGVFFVVRKKGKR
jgi:drug/metabolite transporter (DMT)-like permease